MPAKFDEVIRTMKFIVAEDDDDIIGCGFLDLETARIEAIFVRPDRVRRGTGTKLLMSLEQTARDAGLKSLHLTATLNAVEFYKSAGYTPRGKAKFRHPNGFELDGVSMEKRLAE